MSSDVPGFKVHVFPSDFKFYYELCFEARAPWGYERGAKKRKRKGKERGRERKNEEKKGEERKRKERGDKKK